jgi:predicted nucleotidyltransferase component of viral defense system
VRQRPVTNVAASVRQRLLNLARERGEDFGFVLSRYAVERLLYRLGRSRHREGFVLKGAQLFSLWLGSPHRITRDIDLLCQRNPRVPQLEDLFRELCQLTPEVPDGIEFLAETVRGQIIREHAPAEGVRILVGYQLAGARDRVQVDIGFGDVVVPAPQVTDLPTLLGSPSPRLRVYPREAVVAEKLAAMVTLGMANSRMKDLHDIWLLAREFDFEAETLAAAIRATRAARGIEFSGTPVALTDEFAEDGTKQTQWRAFVRRSRLQDAPGELTEVVTAIADFLLPLLGAMDGPKVTDMVWRAPGPWRSLL